MLTYLVIGTVVEHAEHVSEDVVIWRAKVEPTVDMPCAQQCLVEMVDSVGSHDRQRELAEN